MNTDRINNIADTLNLFSNIETQLKGANNDNQQAIIQNISTLIKSAHRTILSCAKSPEAGDLQNRLFELSHTIDANFTFKKAQSLAFKIAEIAFDLKSAPLTSFDCSTFDEAFAYLSAHPEMTAANLKGITRIPNELKQLLQTYSKIDSRADLQAYLDALPERSMESMLCSISYSMHFLKNCFLNCQSLPQELGFFNDHDNLRQAKLADVPNELLPDLINNFEIIPKIEFFTKVRAYLFAHSELLSATQEEIAVSTIDQLLDYLSDFRSITQAQLEQLTNLPAINFLTVRSSKITHIPKNLVERLKYLNCSDCSNLTFPESFPQLIVFICDRCQFQKFPQAPKLQTLGGYACKFPKLPLLPELRHLYSLESTFEELSAESLPKLREFDCRDTNIKNLPSFPELSALSCEFLDSLPALPKLKSLWCLSCSFERLDLPKLRNLRCESCPQLRDISALKKLTKLLYWECPKLILPDAGVSITYLKEFD